MDPQAFWLFVGVSPPMLSLSHEIAKNDDVRRILSHDEGHAVTNEGACASGPTA